MATSAALPPGDSGRHVVVIGHGPVSHALVERLVERAELPLTISVLCECRYPAFNRVMMTSFFKHRSVEKLALASERWCNEHGVRLVHARATAVDRERKRVLYNDRGTERSLDYDELVFATGSVPFVPPTPGLKVEIPGIFTYRTIADMEGMISRAKTHQRAAVIGGGLLGLEAAKALYDLKLEAHIFEVAPHLMPTQLGQAASGLLRRKVEDLGVSVHTGVKLVEVVSDETGVRGVRFEEAGQETFLEIGLLVVSAGVRPRDELARASGLELGARGGVKVDNHMRSTTDPNIYAVGEVASHNGGMVYGLWAPGIEQADVLARVLGCPQKSAEYRGSDLSTKLKLLGVDVASFGGDASFWSSRLFDLASEDDKRPGVFTNIASDHAAGVCRRLVFSRNENGSCRLLGGVLVGDVGDFTELREIARRGEELWGGQPVEMTYGKNAALWSIRRGSLPSSALAYAFSNGQDRTMLGADSRESLASLASSLSTLTRDPRTMLWDLRRGVFQSRL